MPDVTINRWTDVAASPNRDRVIADVDSVFFSSSARQSFADDAERRAFRDKWLGRYLAHYPDFALVALDEAGHAVGYVAGSPHDPARDPLFADLAFFQAFATLTPRYPAQLHVNLAAASRGQGLGARLVDAFAGLARAAGAPGMHVVTVRGMRNAGFYLANGFVERGSVLQDGRDLTFLGRDLQ
jgi:GNAT superfamily N-acetyltransferase